MARNKEHNSEFDSFYTNFKNKYSSSPKTELPKKNIMQMSKLKILRYLIEI